MSIISKKFIEHPYRIKSREETTIWRWKIQRSSTFLIKISAIYAETIDTREQTHTSRVRFSRSHHGKLRFKIIFNVLIWAYREPKLRYSFSSLVGLVWDYGHLSKSFFISHECKHSEFHSSFAFFCLISLWLRQNQNNMQWDSLLQWRDQRNTQPWIWLQMVFPRIEYVYTHFFRVYSHVNFTTWEWKNRCQQLLHTTIALKSWPTAIETCRTKQNKTKKTTTTKNIADYAVKKKYSLCFFLKHHFHSYISV